MPFIMTVRCETTANQAARSHLSTGRTSPDIGALARQGDGGCGVPLRPPSAIPTKGSRQAQRPGRRRD
jgi:hypothetical protein